MGDSPTELLAQARYHGMCEEQINVSGTLMLRLADALSESEARVAELEARYNRLMDSTTKACADAYDKGRRHGEDDRTSEDGAGW